MPPRKRKRNFLKAYFTGLVPLIGDELRRTVVGQGWSMKMGIRPNSCCEDYDPCQPEIVIYARDLDRAEAALGLFINSLEVLSGPWGVKTRLVPIDQGERRILRQSFEDRGLGLSTSSFDLAALMAAKASRNRRFAYSLALYAVSCHNHVNDPMLFDPAGDKYQARSKSHKDQVRFAYAIIAAFAVIEQLKLTPEQKSFHNGEWIPEKRQALESKLKNAVT